MYPLVVATNPQEPNQLAVGMTDGVVKVIEPSERDKSWGSPMPTDNGATTGRMTSAVVATAQISAISDHPSHR